MEAACELGWNAMVYGEDALSIIEPRRGKWEMPVPEGIVMGFTPPDLGLIRQGMGIAEGIPRKVDFWDLWICPDFRGKVGLAGPAFGAPAAVVLLERLIALGAQGVIGVGSCGSLQPWLGIGSVVVPEVALVEEGTSRQYAPGDSEAKSDPWLSEALVKALRENGIVPRVGKVWTTDAVFRETRGKVMAFQRAGVLAVDMESSALMTVSALRGVRFACALVVSDELGELRWKKGFHKEVFQESLKTVAGVAASTLGTWLMAQPGGGKGDPPGC